MPQRVLNRSHVSFLSFGEIVGDRLPNVVKPEASDFTPRRIHVAAASIIHRDIKPANIFITKRGHAKVLDFGLAKRTDLGSKRESGSGSDDPTIGESTFAGKELTARNTALGTVSYMSPEQVAGKALDERTDLFSFGVTLYEMASGRLPFDRDTDGATYGAILYEPTEPLSRWNPQLPP